MFIVYEPKTNQELSVIMRWLRERKYIDIDTMTPLYDICVDAHHKEYFCKRYSYKGPVQHIRSRNLSDMINQIKANE